MLSHRTESESHASAATVNPVLDRGECPGRPTLGRYDPSSENNIMCDAKNNGKGP